MPPSTQHLDPVTDRLHDRGERVDRRLSPVELAPAVIGDDDRRPPRARRRSRASSGSSTPLTTTGTGKRRAELLDVRPVERGVEELADTVTLAPTPRDRA